MARHTTFSQKVAAGFGVSALLTIAVGAVTVVALNNVVTSKDDVITVEAQQLIDVERLRVILERKVNAGRTYLFTGEATYIDQMRQARGEFVDGLDRLTRAAAGSDAQNLLATVRRSEEEHQQALDAVIELHSSGAGPDTVLRAWDEQAAPKRLEMDTDITAFAVAADVRLRQVKATSTSDATTAIAVVVALGALAAAVAVFLAVLLTRALSRQIGTAVGQVQTSSAELEAVASQQATGAKEEATAMSEITTTINELLATSRQISDSAQRVAQIATDTAGAARAGDGTIEQANASIAAIRGQVDLIVRHMLELGDKSQQIGAVLEIVSELAEQTNILAINATIEATSAGESGRRFAVVADEIRKLADRVSGSAKEIRGLIDDVRGAVNTTVMATETGSKAVDNGLRQFNEVAATFEQIADLVGTTTEAAREIELSTKQQTTAVEQVNVAVVDVAEATRATEASSTQTQQTAAQLAGLSLDLLRLVHTGPGAGVRAGAGR
jgi:methyl-accepting chemotaxis protein